MFDPIVQFQKLPRFFRRHKLLRLMALAGGNIQRVRVNDTFNAFIDVRDGFARLVAIEDEFEGEFFRLARSVLASAGQKVFVDVGANYGLMALGLAAEFGERLNAHLFEPNPGLCDIIQRSLAENPGPIYSLVPKALMGSPGNYGLTFDISHTGAGHVSTAEHGRVPVESTTLGDYIREQGMSAVDFLKIDVEGNEAAVLMGAQKELAEQRIKAVYFEYCHAHLKRSGVDVNPIQLLQDLDWEMFYCRSSDVGNSATHAVGREGGKSLLRLVTAPVEQAITDLLALPTGVAERL